MRRQSGFTLWESVGRHWSQSWGHDWFCFENPELGLEMGE